MPASRLMETRSLSLNLSPDSDVPEEDYYLVMEQVVDEDAEVKAEDAAAFIDELYKTSICDESYELPLCGGSITIGEPPEPPTEEEVKQAIANLGIPDCENQDGSYTVQVEIYRSNLNEEYKLVVEGGSETLRVRVQEEKESEVLVKKQKWHRLEYPTSGNIAVEWQGTVFSKGKIVPAPEIVIEGNILSWEGEITGSLEITQDVDYDLIDILVFPPEEGDFSENTADLLAFYHFEVYEETVEEIPSDTNITATQMALICGEWGGDGGDGGVEPGEEPKDCYSERVHFYKCDCSGRLYDSYRIRTPATCLEDQDSGQVGPVTETTSFVNCNEADKVNDPDYYEEVCCDPPPFPLPECRVKLRIFQGEFSLSGELIAWYQNQYPGKVRFIPVAPAQGYCGVHSTKQIIKAKNCCEDIEPLSIDYEHTETEIDQPGTALLRGAGGEPPYYWQVSNGYTFGNGLQENTTGGYPPETKIYTDQNNKVCTDATTVLHDDCTSIQFVTEQITKEKEPLLPTDLIMAPSTQRVVCLITASTGPYTWTSGGSLSWLYGETESSCNILIADSDFCGSSEINVVDLCGNTDEARVQSTDGFWDLIAINACTIPTSGSITPGASGNFTANGYLIHVQVGFNNPCDSSGVCPPDNIIPVTGLTLPADYCQGVGFPSPPWEKRYIGGCCSQRFSGPPPSAWGELGNIWQYAPQIYEWVCSV